MEQNKLDVVKSTAEELIQDLGIEAKVMVEEMTDNEGTLVKIESEDANLLIGYHAEVLNSIQLILGLMVQKKLGEWQKVIINVGDYRERREEQLHNLALTLAQKAKFSGEVQMIANLSPAERRVVHIALSENTDVFTESEGEGRDRHLLIKPKTLAASQPAVDDSSK